MSLRLIALLLLVTALAGCTSPTGADPTPPTATGAAPASPADPMPPTATGAAPVSPSESAPATEAAALGDRFDLALGSRAAVGDEGLIVVFDEVSDDSRCPVGVECVWAGEATVHGQLLAPDGTLIERFILVIGGGDTVSEASATTVGGYRLDLLSLRPQPQAEGSAPLPYVATLQLSEADGG